MQVLLHGGAGRAPEAPAERAAVLRSAAERAASASAPIPAVCTALRRLEADPRFNAGLGGAVQSDGVVRTDAGLMAGDGTAGAAAAMPGVEHAVDVARAVATETPHVCLAGERAVAFAADRGVATDRDLLTARTRERFAAADPPTDPAPGSHLAWVREHFGEGGGTPAGSRDTVGAVATDGDRLVAATSTAGRWFALSGRVGDVPQVGAGFFADGTAAASATGAGEAIARFGLARRAVAAVGAGASPQPAADRVLGEFAAETGATAGVVVLDGAGATGVADNAERMQTAAAEGQS